MKDSWRAVTFADAVEDVSGGNQKTPQTEFQLEGRFPVVDQGKELVAGFINDEERLCRAEMPVIVFGDHTRCFKYVDFPFCIGADGVKVLRPKAGLEARYLFHFFRQLRLTEGGYARHFKYLRRSEVLVPPISEQRRIAEILDRAEALRAKRRAALAQVDGLTQAIFLEMFGDPVSNPKRWPIGRIRDLLESASYGTSEKAGPTGDYPVLRMNNVTTAGEIDLSDLKFMSLPDAARERYTVRRGDVLFNRTNSADLVGKSALYRGTEAMAYAGYLVRLRVNRDNLGEYLAAFLNSAYAKAELRRMCKSIIGMANINASEIQAMPIAQPPLSLQRSFARRAAAVDGLKSSHRASLAQLDALFASLQHRAFRGEV